MAPSGEDEQAAEDEDAAASGGDDAEDDKAAASANRGAEETAPAGGNGAAASGNGADRVKASPVARRMAGELGVELARLEGSGPGGRIVKADVQAAADADGTAAPPAAEDQAGEAEPAEREQQAAPAPASQPGGAKGEVEIQELTRLQQVVTRRMAESKATAPDFTLTLDVDMTDAVALRDAAEGGRRPGAVLQRHDRQGRRRPPCASTRASTAPTATASGSSTSGSTSASRSPPRTTLIVPTIFDADVKSLGQIARDARAAIEKVRDQKITPPELAGGTFTVSNLGMYGVDHFTAIINPPQACILTVGALAKKPAVDDRGRVVARDQLTLTLVCDHRILYGADGAKFLARVQGAAAAAALARALRTLRYRNPQGWVGPGSGHARVGAGPAY